MVLICYLIGIIILLCVISICLCIIMDSWQPLKSLVISLCSCLVITIICYFLTIVLFSYASNEHWGWLGVILLMTNVTLNLLMVFPPSILITHAIITNGRRSRKKQYTYKEIIIMFIPISVVVFVIAVTAFKIINWIFN